jgi:hypothetical protein
LDLVILQVCPTNPVFASFQTLSNGKMDLTEQTYNPYPGNTTTTITWYCIDETSGLKTELGNFPMSLYAGAIYGLLLFGVIFVGMVLKTNQQPKMEYGTSLVDRTSMNSTVEQAQQFRMQAEQFRERAGQFRNSAASLSQQNNVHTGTNVKISEDVLSRMKELKELRNANLIAEDEYQAKRRGILKSL